MSEVWPHVIVWQEPLVSVVHPFHVVRVQGLVEARLGKGLSVALHLSQEVLACQDHLAQQPGGLGRTQLLAGGFMFVFARLLVGLVNVGIFLHHLVVWR